MLHALHVLDASRCNPNFEWKAVYVC